MDVMFDLETLGTKPGSAIRSIAAAAFELDGDGPVGDVFSSGVKAMSCWTAGLTVDASTLEWWEKQSKEAHEAARANQRELAAVVEDFHLWFNKSRAEKIWCQGAGFDYVIWERAALAVGRPVPWRFWSVMCTRTIYHVAGFDPRSLPREGTHHSATDDVLHQIKCVQAARKKMKNGGA